MHTRSRRVEIPSGLNLLVCTTSLSVTPLRPNHPSRVSGVRSQTRLGASRVACVFICVHAAATTPAQRLGASSAHFPSRINLPRLDFSHRPFRGLLSVYSRCGLHTRAVTVYRDKHFPKASTVSLPPQCSGSFRLEHLAGWDSHPLENAAFTRRTTKADIST